jgi:vesicle transport through interaction with t-SNAREs protein 1
LQRSDDSSVRLELFGDNDIEMDDSKTQLLSDTQRLEASQRKLESGYKLCVETEQIGSQILENLNTQRDTIKRSRDKLRSTNYELGRSSRILNLMTRKAMQTKALIYFITFVIVLFIIYVIYDSFVH